MRDSEVVASIVAGDALGLATAYDRYADPLYKYCRTLLADPADAADAVQDTFVIAASRLGGLRDPDRLRPWLYAVARNEALRILRSKKGTSALDEARDMTDDSGDVAAGAERADLRALLEDAAMGLNPGEREVIELQLRQGLETAEVATVLGVSRNHAHALLARARDQLETCLAALLVGRAGRGECDELGALLAGWDGRLTVLLRKRVHRHIERCPTCDARRARELRPAMLLDLSPGAALAAGAAISLRLAAGAPEGLRAHTITLATGQGVGAVAHRAAVLSRAGAFNRSGFPRPAHGGSGAAGSAQRTPVRRGRGAGGARRSLRSSPQGVAVVAAAIVIAAIIAAVAFALAGNGRAVSPAAEPRPPGVAAAAATSAAASTPASASAGASSTGRTRPSATSAATSAAPSAAAATDPAGATPTTASSADPPSATPTTASPTAAASAPASTPTQGALSESPDGRHDRAAAGRGAQADRPDRQRPRRLARHLVAGGGQRPVQHHQRVARLRHPDVGRLDGGGDGQGQLARAVRLAACYDDHGQPGRGGVHGLHRLASAVHRRRRLRAGRRRRRLRERARAGTTG